MRGCVSDTMGILTQKGNLSQFFEKWLQNQKKINCIHYCHDDEAAVFRVKGLYLKIEQNLKIVRND